MDEHHLLTDVFESAIDLLKADRKPSHTDQEVMAALTKAEKSVIKTMAEIAEGTIRSKRRPLVKMLEEWDKTRKMVPTRWASTDDPWKA